MNISDRARLYGEIRRVLKSGGRFATFDVVLNSGDPHYPVPWARTPATSFLLTAAATREAIEPAGFRTLAWQDDTEAAKAWFAQLRASGPPPSPNLGVVMGPDFVQLAANLGRNLMEGRLGILTRCSRPRPRRPGFTWRTADDRRRCSRWYRPAASRLAQPALDRPDHGAVDAVDLLAADDSGSGVPTTAARLMTYGLIAVGLWLGLESTDLTPGQRRTTWLAVMVPFTLWARCRLERGHQWRLPHGRLTVTAAAVGDLPAGDHRRAAAAVVEAGGAGARCDAGDLARRSSALPGLRQRLSRCRAARAAARRVRRCRRELAMC